MSKNLIRLCALFAVSLGFSGCESVMTPSGILEKAAHAVHRQDLESFNETLSGPAKEKFGTQAGIVELQKKYSDLQLDMGDEKLIQEDRKTGEEPGRPGHSFTITTRDYQVPIFSVQEDSSERREVALATVQCVTKHYRVSVRPHFYTKCLITDFSEKL